jgi:hypothetical protein
MAKTCAVPSSAGTTAGNDLTAWMTALKATIGTGASDTTTCGQIANCDDANLTNCRITVFWDDRRAGGTNSQALSVEAQI